jgi:ketosteroid isomerase-like protein
MRRDAQRLVEDFDDFRNEPEEIIDAGERVVAWVRVRARGRQSGVPVTQSVAELCTYRDGLIYRVRDYETVEEALAARIAD